ncbi:MAG TPA: alpha/beta fold hydrolase, partial [Burkholderiales bacterium]|nr:alpha/beta fold hydrolase [Burkholderiales bacterium]
MNSGAATGSGSDVVLLHGWGTNASVWRSVVERLEARFRVHSPTLPFAAGRDTHDAATLEEIADSLAAGAPARCAVCGWSLGGVVALAWALRAPHQVSRLALIATSPCFVQRADWPHALEVEAMQALARGLMHDPAAVLRRYVALQAYGDVRTSRAARHLRQTLSGTVRQAEAMRLHSGLSFLQRTDLRSSLPHITQPTLVIHGDRDAVTPLAAGEHLARAIPGARLVVVAGAAHAPFASEPQH